VLEPLEARRVLTPFTVTSPTSYGLLPSGATPVGGVVLDLVGLSGRRVVSQLPASELFKGRFSTGTPVEYRGNPGTIGIQKGMTGAVVDALGGGIVEAAVRISLHDGDSGPGDFDDQQDFLRLNGVDFGNFSDIVTEETSADGKTTISFNSRGGFRDKILDTGFFYLNSPDLLEALYESIVAEGQVRYEFVDQDPFDNVYDFTQGVDGGLTDIGQPPVVVNVPPVIVSIAVQSPISAGGTSAIDVVAEDPDAPGSELTYAFDFEGDGIVDATNTTGRAVVTYVSPGTYTVVVTVTDVAGDATIGTAEVRVRDNPPRLVAPPDQGAQEGVQQSFDLGTLEDEVADGPWTITINWGDGSAQESFVTSAVGSLGARSHAYLQDGDYTIGVNVSDARGASASASFVARVAGVAPVITPPAAQTSDEGVLSGFTLGSFTDEAADGPWTIEIDWGDGSPLESFQVLVTGDIPARLHRFAAHGSYTVTLVVADSSRTTSSASFAVSVANVPPQLVPPPDQQSDEGAHRTFALGSFTDQASDGPWTVQVDWGEGTARETFSIDDPGLLPGLPHAFEQDGNYGVRLEIRDITGTSASMAFSVEVANVAPAIDPPGEQAALEGSTQLFALGEFSDPGRDGPWTITVDWGDGSAVERFESAWPGSLGFREHAYAQDGVYFVTLAVRDDATTSIASLTIRVGNQPPALDPAPDQTADEGTEHAFQLGSLFDQRADAPWRVAVDWGDGTPLETFLVDSAGELPPLGHAYARHGDYAVTVEVSDGKGQALAGFLARIANVAPTLLPGTAQSADEGASTLFSLGEFSDPGAEDAWNVKVRWGDGSPDDEFVLDATGAMPPLSHNYAQDGTYTIEVEVGDGTDHTTGAVVVDVVNVAPVLTVSGSPQSWDEGAEVSIPLGSFVDAGADAPWILTLDWGDGSPLETRTFDMADDMGTVAHRYAQDGSYSIELALKDDDGTATASIPVSVQNLPPSLIDLAIDELVEAGARLRLSARIHDPGIHDRVRLILEWVEDGRIAAILDDLGDLVDFELPVGDEAGQRTLRLTVVDDEGAESTRTVVIDVAPASEVSAAVAGAGADVLPGMALEGSRLSAAATGGAPDGGPDVGTLVPATPPPPPASPMSLSTEKKDREEEPEEEEAGDEQADDEAKPQETPIVAVIPAPELPAPPKPAPAADAEPAAPAPPAPPVAVAEGAPSINANMMQNTGISRTSVTRTSTGGATTTAVMVLSVIQVRRMHARRAQAIRANTGSRGGIV
jgi:PKD repeat protein